MQRVTAQAGGVVGVSAVKAEEALRGRLAALSRPLSGTARVRAYALLTDTIQLLARLPMVPFDQSSESHFQRLRALRIRIGSQDLRIAALALANQLTLLTRNRRDFSRIPGLVIDDWSV